MDLEDTIVAPITAPGKGAVAIVRLSGSAAHDIARILCPKTGDCERHSYYGPIIRNAREIDDGICVLFAENASYTGEAVAEISCHGSPEIVSEIVEEAISLGARFARPGEFTERAFLNGTLDLTQAEAVRETVDAVTEAQVRRGALLRTGALLERISEIETDVGRVLASIEAVVDFSDEIGDLNRVAALSDLAAASSKIEALLAGVQPSRLIRNGLRIALAGRPNVGKSSLLNALLGLDRAIVTDVPGTTRDTIEETASVKGYPVVLTDTAGLRDTDDHVEALGVDRSHKAIEQADAVWLIFEAPQGITKEDQLLVDTIGRDVTWVANKSDLGQYTGDAISASAIAKNGIDKLVDWIVQKFEGSHQQPLANDRHEPELQAALSAIAKAGKTLTNDTLPVDLACVDLYDALDRLGRITGRTAPDEVIQRVFADFCIGK